MLNRERLHFRLAIGSGEPQEIAIGHGLVSQLVDDAGALVTTDQLREAGLTPEQARAIALENLACFADESQDLSIQVLGAPGDPLHFLLYSDHPLASACLLLPDLHEHAAEVLQEADLLACVPQRESLVVFPKRDAASRERMVAQLRAIEADAPHPLTFALFSLAASGATPFSE